MRERRQAKRLSINPEGGKENIAEGKVESVFRDRRRQSQVSREFLEGGKNVISDFECQKGELEPLGSRRRERFIRGRKGMGVNRIGLRRSGE